MILPIFQLSLMPSKSGKYGLVFPEESYSISTLTFAIPVPSRENIQTNRLVFPSLINGNYIDFQVQWDKSRSLINVYVSKDSIIRFNLIRNTKSFLRKEFSSRRQGFKLIPYIGKYQHRLRMIEGFILLKPANIEEIDRLYEERKIVLIGFTPKFGRRDSMFEESEVLI